MGQDAEWERRDKRRFNNGRPADNYGRFEDDDPSAGSRRRRRPADLDDRQDRYVSGDRDRRQNRVDDLEPSRRDRKRGVNQRHHRSQSRQPRKEGGEQSQSRSSSPSEKPVKR